MGLSYVAPITCGLSLPSGILTQIGTDLSDTANIAWIPSGWSVASAVSFAIAGNLSDIFGRRYILLSGQLIVLFGSVGVVLIPFCPLLLTVQKDY
jgi:MFS family permease